MDEYCLSTESLNALTAFSMQSITSGSDQASFVYEESPTAAVSLQQQQSPMATIQRLRAKEAAELCEVELAASATQLTGLQDLEASSTNSANYNLLVNGVVKLTQVLDSKLCDKFLLVVSLKLDQAIACEIESGVHLTRAEGFGNVRARQNRWDVFVNKHDLENTCGLCLQDLLLENSLVQQVTTGALGSFFRDLFEGLDSAICELSVLVSDRGAPRQPIHPDTKFTQTAPFFTAFVALQDITADMGPTIILLETHTAEAHAMFNGGEESKSKLLAKSKFRAATMLKGDVTIIDSRVLHCGAANMLKRRALFYITFENPHHSSNEALEANRSLDSGLGKLCLSDFV